MAAGRSLRSLVSRRRRVGDEGEEDDDGPLMVEDSQSEGSVLTDAEDDGADASSLGDPTAVGQAKGGSGTAMAEDRTNGTKPAKKVRKSRKKGKKGKELVQTVDASGNNFKPVADTDAMMNGLRIDEASQNQDAVEFESMGNSSNTPAAGPGATSTIVNHNGTSGDRNRREHEEYRKKRDTDPAFIPNRGNFFMHDTRGQANGQPPQRGAWQGRGRGRGGPAVGGPFSPANQVVRAEQAAEQPWKHDLHDTINEEPTADSNKPTEPSQPQGTSGFGRMDGKNGLTCGTVASPRILSFSTTTLVGKVQIRVFLPGMKSPISFSEVPWKHYIRLPNHRPPLRRDKPVRVSIPNHTQRYIFPSPDRSFIFIPRQMRPNQQGYGRNNQQRNIGGYGYSSRRTSMYGGSMYSASVAASRRSSMAGISRADAFSPNSFGGGNRPVVRLPYGQQNYSAVTTPSGPLSGHHTPTGMQIHTYPLPQQPTYQGTPTTTMHQPRPQKTISVTGIESPAVLQQVQPAQEIQPFQNQLPAHMNEHHHVQQSAQSFSPRQNYQYAQQPQSGTPLNGIPEQAFHGQPFQQPNMGYSQPAYYPAYPTQQGYYYSPSDHNGYQAMGMYMQPGQTFMLPQPRGPLQQAPQSQQSLQQTDDSQQVSAQAPSGMVAHESNGMVFYLPAAEAQQQSQNENYQPAESFVPSYAMPGLPPPTPAPDAAYYYPPMQGQPQPSMYYPPQA
ncbi:Hypothetical protein R9X50_00463400 [Acrodontium crateriforme]|uniref:Btz domain-containing protein n=1 Tax=Acrodontium crateriforme TaxID=150365 RepID=A0AAQ3M8A8_9PEZI|nr:Hypothetical protein R9X50_00463400 [Acrodontium crateriforme]